MDLKETLRELCLSWGADGFGIADFTPYEKELAALYGEKFQGLTRGVSLLVRLPNAVVDEVLEHPAHIYLAYYDIANALLNQMALRLSNYLEKQGYRTYPVPASQRLGEEKEGGVFSHRMAASLAGLGWIGKSCALVTPEVGPRVRLVTVLTDAPLSGDAPMENRCGDCQVCTKACPGEAIVGRNFNREDALSERFLFHKCDDYLSEMRQTFGKRTCGRCIAVCPYGRKKEVKK